MIHYNQPIELFSLLYYFFIPHQKDQIKMLFKLNFSLFIYLNYL